MSPPAVSPPAVSPPVATPEIAWFAALCDDDYEFLGVPDPSLESSWRHCREIVEQSDRNGFDSVLLPSGYALGIDSTAFAAGIATHTETIKLLLAVRMGEMWLPQLARQLATIDQMAQGRLNINIISSDIPGQSLPSAPRYTRTIEWMMVLRMLLNGESVDFHGDFVDLAIDPPRIRPVSGVCPPFYFGGFSDAAKAVAAAQADVFLTWPDTVAAVANTIDEMSELANRHEESRHGRRLRFGLRSHIIVRETEHEARQAANRLVSRLDPGAGLDIKSRSLDASSIGVARQNQLRADADTQGYAEPNLWTGIGRARSGAGAAIVGDPDQVVAKLNSYLSVGVEAFILSGYPHRNECDLVAQHVLSRLAHSPIEWRF